MLPVRFAGVAVIFQAALVLASLLASSAYAALVTWTDPTPSALEPFGGRAQALAQYAGRDLVTYPLARRPLDLPGARLTRRYPSAQFVSSALVLPVSATQVRRTLSNYAAYPALFPTLTRAETIAQTGDQAQVRYRMTLKTGVPLINFNENFTVQHQLSANTLSSLLVQGPFDQGVSRFEWFELGPDRTLVTFTQFVDTAQVNQWIINRIFNALPEVRIGMPPALGVYMLESLRQRHSTDDTTPIAPAVLLPNLDFNARQAQTQRLLAAGGFPVTLVHPPRYMAGNREPLRFVTHIGPMNLSASQLTAWLHEPARMQALFPRQIKRVTVTPNNGTLDAAYQVGLGLGFLDLPFQLRMRFTPEANGVRFQSFGGDVDPLYGRQTAWDLGNQRSLLIMTSASQVAKRAPLVLRVSRALPYPDLLSTVGSGPVILNRLQQLR